MSNEDRSKRAIELLKELANSCDPYTMSWTLEKQLEMLNEVREQLFEIEHGIEVKIPDKKPKGFIGVDLDGTLAEYNGFKGYNHIGKPIQSMLDRVNRWLNDGARVKIFTARLHGGNEQARKAIEN